MCTRVIAAKIAPRRDDEGDEETAVLRRAGLVYVCVYRRVRALPMLVTSLYIYANSIMVDVWVGEKERETVRHRRREIMYGPECRWLDAFS